MCLYRFYSFMFCMPSFHCSEACLRGLADAKKVRNWKNEKWKATTNIEHLKTRQFETAGLTNSSAAVYDKLEITDAFDVPEDPRKGSVGGGVRRHEQVRR